MKNMELMKGAKIEAQTEGLKEYYIIFRDKVWISDLSEPVWMTGLKYFSFSQEESDPGDPSNPCVNYPTELYRSYADCDDQFVRSGPLSVVEIH